MLDLSDRLKLKQGTPNTDPQILANFGPFPRFSANLNKRQPIVSKRREKHSKVTVWPAAGYF